MKIGDYVKFVHSVNTRGEKKILQGKINNLLQNNCALIEVVNDNSRKSHNRTICNRNVSDIVETLSIRM